MQGYQDNTRERYIEDETSGTGYWKMTMKEELNRLDKAFQRLKTEGGKVFTNKKPQATDKDSPETTRQKMKRLAQEWKDAYKASGSK